MFTLLRFMKRKFILNLLLLLLLNLLVKPFWIFGIDRVVQIEVGETEYGMYYALFNFSFLFNIVLDAGITNFNSKHIAQNKHLLAKHFSWMLSTKLMLGIGYGVITFLSALALGYSSEVLPLLAWLVLNQFLASLILYLRSNLSGLLLFKQDSLLSVLDRVIMIGIVGTLLYGKVTDQTFQIMWFVYAQTTAYVITVLVAFLLVYAQAKQIKLQFKPIITKAILKQSLPFALLILLMTLYSRTDAIMIERLLINGAYEAGVYAQGYRLLDALNNIAYLFAVLLLPLFSTLAKEQKSAREIVNSAQSLLLPSSIFIAFICWQFKSDLSLLLYPKATESTFLVFGCLMLGFVAMAFNYIHGTLLTANNCLRWLNYMAVSALVLNVILNVTMIPVYGAYGAAIATVITQFFTVVVHGFLVHKNGYYQFSLTTLAKWGVFLFLLLLSKFALTEFEIDFKLEILGLSVICLVLFFVLGFIKPKQLISLIKARIA